jgi:cytochrome c553
LERAGVDVATIVIPAGTGKPAPVAPAAPVPAPRPAPGGAKPVISFATQVAPILVNSCGGCHVAGQRGNFQMASHEALMRSGMVQRGAGNSSRLVEVILTGDMPRGGGKISAADVSTLVTWIDAGATCDADPMAGLDVLARRGAALAAASPAAAGPAAKPMPLKAGDVSFASEVAPLLIAQCLDCHGERNPENNLRMATLDGLLRGGRTGAAVTAGRGAESLLVKKLRGVGIEGQRMPLNRDPLADGQIAMIEKWINQGAKLDLLTGKEPLETVAAAGRAPPTTGPSPLRAPR